MRIKMKIIKIIKNIFKKKEELDFPNDFAIIDFSPVAKQEGVRDEQNKIIYRYFFDSYGVKKVKKYRYSSATVYALQTVSKIPILDKTKTESIFPIFSSTLPSEIFYEV